MDLKAALRALESRGRLSARKSYAKHGVTGSCFGVPAAEMAALAKELKTDHALALELWDSGNHDARVLATRVADPGQLDDATLLAWLDDVDNGLLADAIAGTVANMATGLSLARRLIDSDGEWSASAGWAALAHLVAGGVVDDHLAEQLLTRVEHTIQQAPNRARHAMNGYVISVGSARLPLRARAEETAQRIGAVGVEHGESGEKTPDAAGAIAKAAAKERSAAKAAAKKRR